jgi:hypothetical protein
MFLAKSEPKSVETRVYREQKAARSELLAQRWPGGSHIPREDHCSFFGAVGARRRTIFERAHLIRVNTDTNPATFGGYNWLSGRAITTRMGISNIGAHRQLKKDAQGGAKGLNIEYRASASPGPQFLALVG